MIMRNMTSSLMIDSLLTTHMPREKLIRKWSPFHWWAVPEWGPLIGGPQCRMSNLRNGNLACPCCLFSPMSHVEFKKRLCPI